MRRAHRGILSIILLVFSSIALWMLWPHLSPSVVVGKLPDLNKAARAAKKKTHPLEGTRKQVPLSRGKTNRSGTPALRGEVLTNAEVPPGAKFTLRIYAADGSELASIEKPLPGTFHFEPKDTEGLFALHFDSPGLLPQRMYAKPSKQPIRVVLSAGLGHGGGLRWRLPLESGGACRATLIEAGDPRAEIHDMDPGKFFLGLRAATESLPPILDRTLRGRPTPQGDWGFELRPVPPGSWILLIHVDEKGDRILKVLLRPGEISDLGLLSVEAPKEVKVRVRDRETRMPLEGSKVFPCLDLWILPWSKMTDSLGQAMLTIPSIEGKKNFILVKKKGFVPKRLVLPETKNRVLEVELEQAEPLKFQAPPGWQVFIPGRPPLGTWTTAGRDGVVETWAPKHGRRGVLFLDPRNWVFERRPLGPKGPIQGTSSLEGKVFLGKDPLAYGQLEITGKSGKGSSFRFIRTVFRGHFRLNRLPPGTYRVVVRIGGQIHDNDHEFYPPTLKLMKEKEHHVSFRLPDGHLKLRILDSKGKPLGRRLLIVRCPYQPPGFKGTGHKISIQTFTDFKGKVHLRGLPSALFHVLIFGDSKTGRGGDIIFRTDLRPSLQEQELRLP